MRLIDADKLKVYLKEYLHYDHTIPWVDAQPTAYDVEKVERQLYTESFCYEDLDGEGYYIELGKALWIVSNGGKE